MDAYSSLLQVNYKFEITRACRWRGMGWGRGVGRVRYPGSNGGGNSMEDSTRDERAGTGIILHAG